MTGALRLVPDQPPISGYDGRRIQWTPWRVPVAVSCIPDDGCRACAATGNEYTAHGLAFPRTREKFVIDPGRPAGRRTRAVAPTAVDAWPVLRLVAFACMSCGHIDVFDVGEDQNRFDHIDLPGKR